MARINKIFISLFALLAITIFSTGLVFAQARGAQGPPSPPSNKEIKNMLKELDKELHLSDEQNARVSELYFAHFDQVEALNSNLETEVKALLTGNQQKFYKAYLEDQKQKRNSQRPQESQRPPR